MKIKNNYLLLGLFVAVLLQLNSCSESNNPIEPENVHIVSVKKIGTINKSQLQFVAEWNGINTTLVYDVNLYQIEYHSNAKNNVPVVASGIICIPITNNAKRGIVSCQHGTHLKNNESPSKNEINWGTYEPAIIASLGYIAASNDYLGFGSTANSNFPQAYHIYSYSTNDWLLFMKAVNEYIDNNSISTSKDLYLTGYSQGGYNVTAAMKKWEAENHNFFNLKEVYAGDGAYLLSDLIDTIFASNDYEGTVLAPLFITAYNYYYDLDLDYKDIYKPEYRDMIDIIYNVNTPQDPETIIPNKLNELFEESFINDMKNKTGNFYHKLAENSITNFIPKNKLFMFHSENDELIPISIANTAFNYYNINGNVEFIKSPNAIDHRNTGLEFMEFVLDKLK